MPELSRRDLLCGSGAFAAVRALHAAVKPVRITGVDLFAIRIPVPPTESAAGVIHRYAVAKVTTDAGISGYSFAGPRAAALAEVKSILVGKDLFGVESHLHNGLGRFGGVEHAVWDAIGRIAGQPVYKLLGGTRDRVRAYLTCLWPGHPDQSQVPFADQVAMAVRVKQAGFHGMKIRAWRPNPLDDAEVCARIKEANGRDFHLMFDRTARGPEEAGQRVWDFDTGLRAARALEKAGADWLEEPFARDDFETPARLAREVEIKITGGEGWRGLDPFREGLVHDTYDVVQPDLNTCGGLLTIRKISALCEAFHKPCIGHGSFGLNVAGRIQAHAAWGAPLEELALATPPLLPQEQWAPALKILKSKELYTFRNGEIQVPQCPGLGLDLDEEAIEHYRV